MSITDYQTPYDECQDSVNSNTATVTPPDTRARELRTNIDRLLLQIAENNAASHRAIGRQFALLVDES